MDSYVFANGIDKLRALEVRKLNIPVSVGLFDGQIIVDPSADEEEVLQATATFVFAFPGGTTLTHMHQVPV